jgi:hypothetical protein
MTKLCPRGKAAAKRKFKVYPSAYANAYASKICAGKIKDPSGVKRKDFRGPKPAGKAEGGRIKPLRPIQGTEPRPRRPKFGRTQPTQREKPTKFQKPKKAGPSPRLQRRIGKVEGGMISPKPKNIPKGKPKSSREKFILKQSREKAINSQETRKKMMGGGMMQMPRAMYGRGGGVCKRGMGRAYGKNS